MDKLLAYIKQHHMQAWGAGNGRIGAVAVYCKDGVAYEEIEFIEANLAAVRDWLGY